VANSAPNTRKSKHDVAPWVRHNFLKAIRELVRRKGVSAHHIMADWLEEDPLGTLRAVALFQERQRVDVTGSVSHKHDHDHRAVAESDATSSELVAALVDGVNRLADARAEAGRVPANGANGSGVPPGGDPGPVRH